MSDIPQIGDRADSFEIVIGGYVLPLVESYEITTSFFTQPSSFCVWLGPKLKPGDDFRERVAYEILDIAKPGTPFELRAIAASARPDAPASIGISSGFIDSRGAPAGDNTKVELRGRDKMARVISAFVEYERAFLQPTYYALTRTLLNSIGFREKDGKNKLIADDFTRKQIRRDIASIASGETVDQISRALAAGQSNETLIRLVETGATGGAGQMAYLAPKARLGTRVFDFLTSQYKLAALYLYAGGDGNFYLTRPHPHQLRRYQIHRVRSRSRTDRRSEISNVLNHSFNDDTAQRHSKAIIYGRAGGGAHGRRKVRGECIDDEMVGYGIDSPIVIHDQDVKSDGEAAYLARKIITDERRKGWSLVYTVAGHTTRDIASLDPTARLFWAPDTCVAVFDEELGINDTLWVESVTFRRGPEGTTTQLELCHPSDIVVEPAPDAPRNYAKSPAKTRENKPPAEVLPQVQEAVEQAAEARRARDESALREGGNSGTSGAGFGLGVNSDPGAGGAGNFSSGSSTQSSSGGARPSNGGRGGAGGTGNGGFGGAGGF